MSGGVQTPDRTVYTCLMSNTTFRLANMVNYEKYDLDGRGVEHVVSFTPDDKTDTVTLTSEMEGYHMYTKEMTREGAREAWRRLIKMGYRRINL